MLPLSGQSAAGGSASQSTIRTDSSAVKVRVPSGRALGNYRLDRNFIYDDKPEPVSPGSSFWSWVREQLQKLFRTKAMGYVLENMNYIIMALAALIVILVIRKLSLSGVIYRRDKTAVYFHAGAAQEEMNVDPDLMISEAVKNKDFRTAVRYYYIRSLKHLAGKEMIEWQVNKTNSQYIKELREPGIKNPFEKLTLLFEKAWYGGTNLEEAHFEEARNLFEAFYQAVEEM